ncbi:DUF1963 domain-containing protein [Streptomyces sp. NPDC056796]|uniref:DUF1963 domain-containing protein n=1 Tax=Streptomyces sp. NPDC056796 TaxID=3345947 RepID=UPI00368BE907
MLLPADAPDIPERLRLIASLDLAAIPEAATNLPLPPDGHLLLFAHIDVEECDASGEALYVPAGTPVTERPRNHGPASNHPWSDTDHLLHGELRLQYDVSLPDNSVLYDPARHPHAAELRRAWSQVRYEDWGRLKGTHLQIDGYSTDSYGEADPVTASASWAAEAAGEAGEAREAREAQDRGAGPWELPGPEDWALLAQWNGRIDGYVYWTIARKDVAARQFDRASVLGFFEGPL